MRKMYINKYVAFLIITVLGAVAVQVIVREIKVISETTPRAFAADLDSTSLGG